MSRQPASARSGVKGAPAASRLPLAVSALAAATYFLVSAGVANFYPFARFKMFSETGVTSASRVVVVDAKGVARDVGYYARFDCEGYSRRPPESCAQFPFYFIRHWERQTFEAVEERMGADPQGEPVTLARRIWRLDRAEGGEPRHTDCVVATCRASRE